MKNNNTVTSIFALGGLGEVGKNMYVIEHGNEIIIIDAGVLFPEDHLLGIDYVIQDITYLKQKANNIKALFITHGHEDHIGGITFLLQHIDVPVIYAPQIAVDLIKNKLKDRNIRYKNLKVYDSKSEFKFKNLSVDFVATTHSIPDSHGIVVRTPNGNIFITGDFKFDLTPVGPIADLHKMAKLGTEGVKLLLSDSTNSLTEGSSKSESIVDEALNDVFAKHNSRIIVATFASNIYRIKHIVETCRKHNRKIVTFGRSMENAKEIALKNNLIEDKTIFIEANEAKDLKKNEICILCTGSQGEPLAALSRIADGNHRQIELIPDDIVVFSSSPIPGNKASINRVINKIYLKGVKVYTNTELSDIHTSGHANQEELKLMLRLIKPEYFFPVHGEYRMLKQHANLAVDCDIPKENIFVLQNGDVLEMSKQGIKKAGRVPAGDVYVDGSRIGDIGSVVINDRKLMSRDGILVVFSSSPIPGNKASINRIINKIYLKGVKVYTNTELSDIHTSGHANQEELKLMLRLIKPEYFFPVHGEYRMLKQHANLAVDCDIPKENIFILQNGDVLEMSKQGIKKAGRVPAGDVYVDGSRIGDIGSVVINDRKLMSRDGILVAFININPYTKSLLIKPNITTRGFVLVNENISLIQKLEEKVTQVVNNSLKKTYNYLDLKNQIILELNPFINNLTGRRPIILPVIMEVKK